MTIKNPQDWDVYTLHGFNVSDFGEQTTDRLADYFVAWGFNVLEIDRDHENLLDVRFEAAEVTRKLEGKILASSAMQHHMVMIGHSHGCNLIHQTLQRLQSGHGPLPKYVFLINPALRVDAAFPEECNVFCFHSNSDNVVLASKLLRILPWNWIKKHRWGPAGKYGLSNPSDKRVNCDLEELMNCEIGHSTVFHDSTLTQQLAHTILDFMEQLHGDDSGMRDNRGLA